VSDIYLHPGESYLARKPAIIRTILGSCVGVTFWSARLGVGALTHSQLPRCPTNSAAGLSLAEPAAATWISPFVTSPGSLTHWARMRTEVEVKLFGGADVLLVSDEAATKPTVGKLNCEAAIEVLRDEGLAVIASSLGGTSGLNIRFDTRTGEVLLASARVSGMRGRVRTDERQPDWRESRD
jgi:chemotaxis protein CheD